MGTHMPPDRPESTVVHEGFFDEDYRARYILAVEELGHLLEEIAGERSLFAPVGDSFRRIEALESISQDGVRALFGPKKVFFPDYQEIFRFDARGRVEDALKPEKRAIFGARACDVRALGMLDRYFGEMDEPFYKTARENTLVVGLTCTESMPSCFCTQFGGLSDAGLDYDIWLTPLNDGFLAESGSEEGKRILASLSLPEADEEHLRAKEELIKRVEESMDWKPIPDELIFSSMRDGLEHPVWKEIAERCFACGKCNMICPTCHCYDVRDETDLYGNGKRVRVWDACHLFRYGLVAGDHNFRGKRLARAQYRVYDKFYYPVERYGRFACTGCGRCLDVCNADIDLRDILKRITGGTAHGE